jgi:hypothetical protein
MAESLIPSAARQRPARTRAGRSAQPLSALHHRGGVDPVFLVAASPYRSQDELVFRRLGSAWPFPRTSGARRAGLGFLPARSSNGTDRRRSPGTASRWPRASLLGIAVAARSLWSLIAIMVLGAGANAAGSSPATPAWPGTCRRAAGLLVRREAGRHPGQHAARRRGGAAVALTLGWRWAFVLAAVLAAPRSRWCRRARREKRSRGQSGERATGPWS